MKRLFSCKGVREACWKHQHSGDKLSILITGYFPNASPLLRPYRSQESEFFTF
ncbi:hypothetical protein H5968_08580 [Sphaerospermopsis sp. LEGE 00249]|uniref:hypothetical protein n=1 Tax=Sphaerospermopsis sp. LEGE 00249 TaxID=1380707 RepID=UPI00164E6A27|nr:hypothetical protein [Sphaerospermopsis sp. LEGE 00249]MBC5795203.1 hypothetical protein [Sphaerospermopsis sp. LEGE 00249]